MPDSVSIALVPKSKNLNTDEPYETDNIVFSTATVSKTSPVETLTILIETVTLSTLYCCCTPIPKYLAPAPPVAIFESYPTTPPSTIRPANFKGFNLLLFSSSYCSLVDLISCLSLIRLSNPILSTTLNQVPLPTSCNACITQTSAPCVTALLNCENLALGFLCPVLSAKLYTAIVIAGPSSCFILSNFSCSGDSDKLGPSTFCTVAHPVSIVKTNTKNIFCKIISFCY